LNSAFTQPVDGGRPDDGPLPSDGAIADDGLPADDGTLNMPGCREGVRSV
jgi:hypothetical protein